MSDSSVRSLWVVEERTRSSECFQQRMTTGRASGLTICAPITPHGMYLPSTPLPSPSSLLLSEKDMVEWC